MLVNYRPGLIIRFQYILSPIKKKIGLCLKGQGSNAGALIESAFYRVLKKMNGHKITQGRQTLLGTWVISQSWMEGINLP
jgi:hypothetical protein